MANVNLFKVPINPVDMVSIYDPEVIRANARRRLFQQVPMFGGGRMGGAQMGGAALGMALGQGIRGLFGGDTPEAQRAEGAFAIANRVKADYPETLQPDQVPGFMQQLGSALIGEGYYEEGFKALSAIPGQPMEVSEGTQKDIRKNIVMQRNKVEEKASTMVESMNRIETLANQAREGNRSARGTMVQQVARLAQGAGVITDRDAAAVTGDQSGFAFLLSAIMPGVDADTQAALRGIDPLGPGFNTDNLLTVANALLTSGRDSVNNRMSDLRAQATEARLKPQGIKALFAGSSNIDALNDLGIAQTEVRQEAKTEMRPAGLSDADWEELQRLRKKYGR